MKIVIQVKLDDESGKFVAEADCFDVTVADPSMHQAIRYAKIHVLHSLAHKMEDGYYPLINEIAFNVVIEKRNRTTHDCN